MDKQEYSRLAVVETKLEKVEDDLKELKSEVKETREDLAALVPKLDALIATVNEIKTKQNEGVMAFINKNNKLVLSLVAVLILGLKGGPAAEFVFKLLGL